MPFANDRYPWDEAKFIDAKCGALHAASEAICDQLTRTDDLARITDLLRDAVKSAQSIGAFFGTATPEHAAAQTVVVILQHDHEVMLRQAQTPSLG